MRAQCKNSPLAVPDRVYMYDRGVVVGAAQHMVSLGVNFWDVVQRKWDMPIMVVTPEVLFRDLEVQVWDVSARLPLCFEPKACDRDARLAISSHRLAARLLWPVCESGQLTALLPKGQKAPPDAGLLVSTSL